MVPPIVMLNLNAFANAAAEAFRPPPPRFHCRLAGQPDHLVPGHQLQILQRTCSTKPLYLNRSVKRTGLRVGDSFPLVEGFDTSCEMLWVEDARTKALQPFWIDPVLETYLADVAPGDLIHNDFPKSLARVLEMARIFVSEDDDDTQETEWQRIVAISGERFDRQKYVPLAGLIHPFHLAAMRRYFRTLLRTGGMELGDNQNSTRYVAHNDPVARFFHMQLTEAVSDIAGFRVKPSYVYAASYLPGSILNRHIDREQCEISISFALDYSPEPRKETAWPLLLHPRGKTLAIFQALGDALFYKGCEVPHSRDQLHNGHTSTSIFFHYVREGFTGSLD